MLEYGSCSEHSSNFIISNMLIVAHMTWKGPYSLSLSLILFVNLLSGMDLITQPTMQGLLLHWVPWYDLRDSPLQRIIKIFQCGLIGRWILTRPRYVVGCLAFNPKIS